MYCGNCGKQINNEARFCPYCGSARAYAGHSNIKPTTAATLARPMPCRKKRRSIFKRWWFWIIIGAFLSVLFFATCVRIGLQSTEKTQVPEISETAYKSMCAEIPFDQLARNPGNYKDRMLRFTGEVIQVIEGTNKAELRMNVTLTNEEDDWAYYEDTIYVTICMEEGADRILEDDIITVYGVCTGAHSYKSIFGQKITLPGIDAKYYELVE